jgi:hypothetical protein
MRKFDWRSWLGATVLGAAAAMPVQAGNVDFEDVAPTLFSASSINSGEFTFESDGFGFSGVDSAAAFVFGNAPPNATGQFLFMLNNDGMLMRRTDGNSFFLEGFDAAFIPPLGGLGAGIVPGELFVLGEDVTGNLLLDIFVFPASTGNGDFEFTTFRTAGLAGAKLASVGFFACIYDVNGFCSFSAIDVPAQFALDNIDLPEPGALLMAFTALALAGFVRRRAQA